MCQIMFMASDCLVKTFTVCEATKMEAASPSIFVDVSCEVVVTALFNKSGRAEGVEQHTVLSR